MRKVSARIGGMAMFVGGTWFILYMECVENP